MFRCVFCHFRPIFSLNQYQFKPDKTNVVRKLSLTLEILHIHPPKMVFLQKRKRPFSPSFSLLTKFQNLPPPPMLLHQTMSLNLLRLRRWFDFSQEWPHSHQSLRPTLHPLRPPQVPPPPSPHLFLFR